MKRTIRDKRFVFTWNKKCSCYQFSFPPFTACPGAGARCRNPGAICNFCYARYGRQGQCESVRRVATLNLRSFVESEADRTQSYVDVFLDSFSKLPAMPYFRWLSGGDIINGAFLHLVQTVALLYPEIHFWCPTQLDLKNKYRSLMSKFVREQPLEKRRHNMVFRRSAPIIGKSIQEAYSTMVLLPGQRTPPGFFRCPGACDTCRMCWRPTINHVAYPFHGSAVLTKKLKIARKTYGF